MTAKARKPMPAMVKRICLHCEVEFEARAADVKRGWGKFHSKSCKAKYQEQAKAAGAGSTESKEPEQ